MKKATKTVTAFAVLTLFAGSSHAAPITIQNASFETGNTAGWSFTGSSGVVNRSSFVPFTGTTGNLKFAYTEGTATQTLAVTDTFLANTTYTFKGYGVDNGATSDTQFLLGYFDGGSFVELNEATYDTDPLPSDAWTLLDGVTYSTGASGAELGQQIVVRIAAVIFGGQNQGIWFDELSLSSAPVPEPSSLALIGLGGLCVLRRRRQA